MSDKRVLLVNSNQVKPPVAPIALDYLACALKQHEFQVDLLDLCFADDALEAINDYFAEHAPLLVGVSVRNTEETLFPSLDSFIPRLKQITDAVKGRSSAPIVLGGAGFSVMPEAILDYCQIGLGIWGEGEYSLPLLAFQIAANQDYHNVPGLIFRNTNGFRRNRPMYISLGQTCICDRRTVDNARYFAEGGMGAVESKRGCNQDCVYCADPVCKGNKLRLRSPESVVDEIEQLLGMGIDHFHFCDSEFNLPIIHAQEVCRAITKRKLGGRVRWYAYASPTPFSTEMATLFLRSGCAGINFGVDSADDHMLQSLGKDFTSADVKATAAISREQGLVFMYDLLLGGPGETVESLRHTIETMKKVSPSRVGISLGVRIVPSTRLAAMVARQGPLAQNPNLRGNTQDNNHLLFPVYYLSSALGPEPEAYVARLIAGDDRFLSGFKDARSENYNYIDNGVLVDAIKSGYRGAFWDILRRLADQRNNVTI